ncbi:PH domain-containing protein [Flavobacterium sp. F-328]|uniref:PH domain-containing protein n=1 Tax=Flavobacterium erciyesense TaxID=2825842 RepID=A0ABS5D3T1_9FLAO|nr:PH domain-containing protein [Flavobacterium erciyesense]MBQ0908683.1 PH domain-containing protein [Flavobacterium erciyesense]
MRTDFSQPQRQSAVGIWVLFFYTLQQYARAFWPIFLVFFFRLKNFYLGYIFGVIGLFLVLIALISYLKYRNFTFYLDEENQEFIINEGILNKTKTAIQLNKIQQVNINQSFIQKIIGVYELQVDTAGSNKKEGNIKAISQQLALDLKACLLENEGKERILGQNEPGTAAEFESNTTITPFIKISFFSLLKVGITSNYQRTIALLVLFFSTVFESLSKLSDQETGYEQDFGAYFDYSQGLKAIIMGFFMVLVAVLLLNIIRVFVQFFNFNIAKQKGSLLLSYGLLNSKSTIVKPEKVQITTVTQNYFQRKWGILDIRIKQATGGAEEQRKSAIEIPGCDPTERDAIFQLLFSKLPEKGIEFIPNYRKLVFGLFIAVVIPVALFFGLANTFFPEIMEYVGWVPFYVVLMIVLQYFKFKNYRLYIHPEFIIKTSGAWDVSEAIILPQKIQAITTSQLFWHKKADIGSVILHTAGGNISFQLANYTVLKEHINRWLYELETSNSNWM